MSKSPTTYPTQKSMAILSRLMFPSPNPGPQTEITEMSREDFDDLRTLADLNHVVIRGMEVFKGIVDAAGDSVRAEWAASALATEQARIRNAVPFLKAICDAFGESGYDVTVIKSLDHWPDLGSDLDLYTNTDPKAVIELMRTRFQATTSARSWGDRLACKWNFEIPGLPEAVEIHMGRLGQTGEQIPIASHLVGRTRAITVDGMDFRVTSISDRIMISTLQRMYRHFYFRLCDVVDSAGLVESGVIDYQDLQAASGAAGIWEGVATYLVIVSDYVKQYRGTGLDLPQSVLSAARFGGELIFFNKSFLRVPILPQSASLYRSQLTGLLRKKEIQSSARLGLLPWLATAALVGEKITGSDKGIW